MTYATKNSLVQFQDIYPGLGSHITLYMLESFGSIVKLKSPYPAQEIQVQIWTNTLNKFNSEGLWSAINLDYQTQEEPDIYIFQQYCCQFKRVQIHLSQSFFKLVLY